MANDQERAAFEAALSQLSDGAYLMPGWDVRRARAALAAAPVQHDKASHALREIATHSSDGRARQLAHAALAAAPVQAVPLAWRYEDTLPSEYPYDTMFPHSQVRGGVRMFPVFAPAAPQVPAVPQWLYDKMLVPLIYSAILSAGRPMTIGDFEAAAERVADMLRRKAAPGAPQPAEPAPLTVPHPASQEANAMIDSELTLRNWPTNTKNAARAGYEACRKLMGAGIRAAGVKEQT